ncbi:MAG: hypothetical protein CBC29_04970 [Methylococcaceae bacterium TMED69]|nr:MAG: hypothetical protein CBC29_04970 [Methylococcaceae bacterium TMED69]
MIGFIGGSGFENFLDGKSVGKFDITTEWGKPSQAIKKFSLDNQEFLFLQRHGDGKIPPHKINYQANIKAFHDLGVKKILASAAVGGITIETGTVVIPDQIIDYTYNRPQTFFENVKIVKHIEFSQPYNHGLRFKLLKACEDLKLNVKNKGVHGITQGPRLETSAEIRRLKNDGCDIVGMTGMPETCLAAELDIEYACIAHVVNPAAGITGESISIKCMENEIKQSAHNSFKILAQFLLNEQLINR